MANFILLEPNSDIHLVRTDFPAGKQAVTLRVFLANTNVSGFFVIREILDPVELQRLHFDFFPLNQAIVNFDPATRTITPGTGTGTVHLQIRYLDPDLDAEDQFHYLLARIQVHERMNGWWFGNSSLSVFRDLGMSHSQPSLYALFDRAEPGGGEVGDITGHGYVDLSIDDRSVCEIDINVTTPPTAVGKFKDRLRGLKVGNTILRGSFLGRNQDIPLHVVEFNLRPDSPVKPVLERERDFFNSAVTRAERHNILFLSEGVIADTAGENKLKFARTVTEGAHRLFDSERHAPYNILKDGFNLWSHFEPSNEVGLTCGPPLDSNGVQIPTDVDPPKGSPTGAFTLLELLTKVGLPAGPDTARSVEQLKTIWNAAGSIPRLLGYDNALVVPDIVEAWKKLFPAGIPQAVDTFYGTIQGRRWGERFSKLDERVNMVVPPVAGDPDFDRLHAALAKRMFEWYVPEGAVRVPRPDQRRFAPEFLDIEEFLLARHFRTLADPLVDPSNPFDEPDHRVGRVWDQKTEPDPNIPTRQINSAGLVCIFLNGERVGGNTIRRGVVYVTLGSAEGFTFRVDTGDPDIRPLTLTPPQIKTDLSALVDKFAHEFGHSFNLGDEYEEFKGPDPKERSENSDNLTSVKVIEAPEPPGGHNDNFPTPIDPNKVKWLGLHRIETSDILTSATTSNGNQIVVQLLPGATFKWHRIKAQGRKVFLRQFHATATDIRQLPVTALTLKLVIARDLDIASFDDANATMTLTGALVAPNNAFSAGSVVYVPKLDGDGDQLHLVENEVRLFMSAGSWNPSDPGFQAGISLTENHNAADADKSDPKADEAADNPPDIPGFSPPCKKYKLIGLYEGGGRFTTHTYRPAGACKMRDFEGKAGEGEFCFVCKYLIVNRVNAGRHAVLDARYYPHKKQVKQFFGGLPINIGDIH